MDTKAYIHDSSFEQVDYTTQPLVEGEYENCVFKNCNFHEQNLSEFQFIDCQFIDCDLSLAKLNGTTFREVDFNNCKLLGLLFTDCHPFGLSFSFRHCILNYSSFYNLKIRKTTFDHSQFEEVDFTESDLTASKFIECNLNRSTFDHTILEKVDFRTSHYYSIDPERNRIRKAKFSIPDIVGLLDKYDIEITP